MSHPIRSLIFTCFLMSFIALAIVYPITIFALAAWPGLATWYITRHPPPKA
jgi:hypothetical protein